MLLSQWTRLTKWLYLLFYWLFCCTCASLLLLCWRETVCQVKRRIESRRLATHDFTHWTYQRLFLRWRLLLRILEILLALNSNKRRSAAWGIIACSFWCSCELRDNCSLWWRRNISVIKKWADFNFEITLRITASNWVCAARDSLKVLLYRTVFDFSELRLSVALLFNFSIVDQDSQLCWSGWCLLIKKSQERIVLLLSSGIWFFGK